jgi:serine/threonine protein kinase
MIFDFVNGGDLFFHIDRKGNLSEKEARYYGAQILLGLEYLHKRKYPL